MTRLCFILGVLACGVAYFGTVKAACSISLNQDLKDPQPLFLKPHNTETTYKAFIEPINNAGDVNFAKGDLLVISCPGGKIKLQNVPTLKSITSAACNIGSNFIIEGKRVALRDITCSKQPDQVLRYTGDYCGSSMYNKRIEMGFNIDASRFFSEIIVCFDPILQNAVYAVSAMPPTIGGYETNYPRVPFKEAGFYHLGRAKLDNLYTRAKQRTTINKQLGLAAGDTKYIHATGDFYLARGHLAAKSDFLFGSQQRLTFNFINVAPQWQILNGGNWFSLENSVRSFASKRKLELIVYTGTEGILTYPHAETGEETPIYLYAEANSKAIPVPALFWKVVYHPKTKAGVAFIGVNNPHVNSFVPICTDICNQVTWPSWKPQNQKSGFGYCCEVNQLRRVVKSIPSFQVTSILI